MSIPPLPGLTEADRQYLERLAARGQLGTSTATPLRPLFAPDQRGSQALRRHAERARQLAQQTEAAPRPAPAPACPVCRDHGFVRRDLPPSHPDYGRALPCTACDGAVMRADYRAQLRRWLRRECPVPDALLRAAQQPVDVAYIDDVPGLTVAEQEQAKTILANAYAYAKQWALRWPAGGIFALDGPPGAAKSHIACKFVRRAWLQGHSAHLVTGGQLSADAFRFAALDDLRARYTAFDLLVIDEVDHIYNSVRPEPADLLFFIVDERQKAGLCTVLTGNQLERLWPALQDRASSAASCWVGLAGVPSGRAFFAGDSSWRDG